MKIISLLTTFLLCILAMLVIISIYLYFILKLNNIINEVINREDLLESKNSEFIRNLEIFRGSIIYRKFY